jgi:UDP-glucose 4-epimerase
VIGLEGKNVVVTGGSGFVGSHLIERIIDERPAWIIALSNFSLGNPKNLVEAYKKQHIDFWNVDISNREEVVKFFEYRIEPIDVVFNLAAVPLPRTFTEPELTVSQNVNMTLNLCEMQRKGRFKTLIQFSSSEVYGTKRTVGSMNEQHPTFPTTPYAASKLAADHIVLTYINTFGIDASIVRPFNIYGPRQNMGNFAGVIPLTIGRILRREPVYIDGDGTQTRDYTYVTDVVDATVDIYKNPETRGKVINIASGKGITIRYLIGAILGLMDCNAVIEYRAKRVADVENHEADISLAKSLIGYSPKVSFIKGMKTTIEWYRKKENYA